MIVNLITQMYTQTSCPEMVQGNIFKINNNTYFAWTTIICVLCRVGLMLRCMHDINYNLIPCVVRHIYIS